MVVMLYLSATTVFAQAETSLLPLSSTFDVNFIPLAQSISGCDCSKTDSVSKKQKSVFSLDIPLLPFWETVQEIRIKNRDIQFGDSTTPWEKTVKSKSWPLPRVVFASPDFRMSVEGGAIKTSDANLSRKMTQVSLGLEGSLWFVLIGADGLVGQEQIPGIMKGVNFEANFRRRSGGGQGWLGVKLGDFNHNFIVGRYGRGYIYTDGSTRFNIPDVDDIDWLPVYVEEFKTTSFSVEGKMRTKLISQSVRFDGVEYKRVTPSPDSMRFGENRLEDLWLTTETEIVPFPRIDFLRGVVVLTKDFKDKNRLMFFNDYSAVRIFIRLAF
ncbi:MAG: hypothetical protein UT29_C0001G0004 [Candidatus Yanofskybacteria bacterium GW2011_GWA1_39_13]|uniref:Uncharacterized protein n=1 Tax=Yanofskybacteria sp. (strain GW2011_GWA1_39_13) TaxID=1619019 RepID=A0A0G0MEL7_YANXG|nr:MAG: hypothetical protein UT29_C0001G0004 [Candidatus Yanofskybacteria bacterium GW2011_GWA1_39_13]